MPALGLAIGLPFRTSPVGGGAPPAPVAGDPIAFVVRSDGWSADLTFKGMVDGGAYDFGLGANNDPLDGDPKVEVVVRSPAFTDSGGATTIDRTVYGTKQVRKPYPDQALNDEVESGDDVSTRIALNEYVYSGDTIVSVTIISGLYNDGLLASRSRSIAGTNNSTAAHQKVVGNWSWPGWQRLTASSKLRAVVFHRHGQQGRPVRAVKFTVTDGTTTVTEIITAPTYDSSVGDAVPVVEYVTTTDLTAGLTQGAVLTANFVAYPWVGDAGSALDTADGVNSNATTPTPLYAPQLHVCDKTGGYASSLAVVDPAAGNDATGAVSTVLATAEATPYLTMAAAFNALRTYNNTNYSRNNCGGSVMYLRTGNNAFVNGSVTLGTTPDTYLTITRHPSDPRSGVFITNQVTGKSLGLRLKIYDVTISATNAAGTFSPGGNSALWIDSCALTSTSGIPVYQNRVWSITRCAVTGMAQWFAPNSTEDWRPALIRGNALSFTTGTCNIRTYCLIGNLKTGNTTAGSFNLQRTSASSTAPKCDNGVVAFNKFLGLNNNLNTTVGWVTDMTITHGQAIVQNVFENFKSTSTPLVQVAADGAASSTDPNNNIIIWNNTFMGQRQNLAYNDNGSEAPVRLYWSVKNNIHYDDNIKTDTFTTANAARVNNWSQLYGVGWSGNVLGKNGTAFTHEFAGLKSTTSNWSAGGPSAYFKFTAYAAYTGTGGDGAGGGDYTLAASAPALDMQADLVIPNDIAGNARASTDAAGAYRQ